MGRWPGDAGAAELAAASLLDTLEAGAAAYPPGRRVLALAGDLRGACRAKEIRAATRDWLVVDRTARPSASGSSTATSRRTVWSEGLWCRFGMDTPQVRPDMLRDLAEAARRHRGPVLGPSLDGGWWVARHDPPSQAAVLTGVPLSRPTPGGSLRPPLAADGYPAARAAALRDVTSPRTPRRWPTKPPALGSRPRGGLWLVTEPRPCAPPPATPVRTYREAGVRRGRLRVLGG